MSDKKRFSNSTTIAATANNNNGSNNAKNTTDSLQIIIIQNNTECRIGSLIPSVVSKVLNFHTFHIGLKENSFETNKKIHVKLSEWRKTLCHLTVNPSCFCYFFDLLFSVAHEISEKNECVVYFMCAMSEWIGYSCFTYTEQVIWYGQIQHWM